MHGVNINNSVRGGGAQASTASVTHTRNSSAAYSTSYDVCTARGSSGAAKYARIDSAAIISVWRLHQLAARAGKTGGIVTRRVSMLAAATSNKRAAYAA